jgi:hypothetical protein
VANLAGVGNDGYNKGWVGLGFLTWYFCLRMLLAVAVALFFWNDRFVCAGVAQRPLFDQTIPITNFILKRGITDSIIEKN